MYLAVLTTLAGLHFAIVAVYLITRKIDYPFVGLCRGCTVLLVAAGDSARPVPCGEAIGDLCGGADARGG